MKEIQFRVWNPDNRVMVYSAELVNTGSGVIVDVRCGVLHAEYQDSKTLSWNEAELMQYTGLHDKNGKEIYEGEILKSTTGQIGRVDWRNDTLTYVVSWFAYSSPMGSYESYLYAVASSSTSIGTIYENPELLEAKTRL